MSVHVGVSVCLFTDPRNVLFSFCLPKTFLVNFHFKRTDLSGTFKQLFIRCSLLGCVVKSAPRTWCLWWRLLETIGGAKRENRGSNAVFQTVNKVKERKEAVELTVLVVG